MSPCQHGDATCAYALGALPAAEMVALRAHIASCSDCQAELEALYPAVDSLVCRPIDVLRPAPSLQFHLAKRIAEESGQSLLPPPPRRWREPEWEQVAPQIECKLLATDAIRRRVSMLVRLAPGASYPAHIGAEELHLLDGELSIGQRKIFPGDYHNAAPGTGNICVWSQTGCTCFLTTSTEDVLEQSVKGMPDADWRFGGSSITKNGTGSIFHGGADIS